MKIKLIRDNQILIEIPFGVEDQEIATALESNPRIYKILTSLYNSGMIEGAKQIKSKASGGKE